MFFACFFEIFVFVNEKFFRNFHRKFLADRVHNYKYRDDYNRDNELYELSWKEKEIRAAVEEGDRIDPILKDVMKYRTTVKMRRRKMLKKRMFDAKQLRKERQALVRPNFWMQDSVRKKIVILLKILRNLWLKSG